MISGIPAKRANKMPPSELSNNVSEMPIKLPVFSPRSPPNATAPDNPAK